EEVRNGPVERQPAAEVHEEVVRQSKDDAEEYHVGDCDLVPEPLPDQGRDDARLPVTDMRSSPLSAASPGEAKVGPWADRTTSPRPLPWASRWMYSIGSDRCSRSSAHG